MNNSFNLTRRIRSTSLILLTLLLVSSCQPKEDEPATMASMDMATHKTADEPATMDMDMDMDMASMDMPTHEAADKQLYQCAMHPNVVADHEGNCPICGMQLQPVKAVEAHGIPGRSPVELSNLQKQLINLRTVAVKRENLTQNLRTTGIIKHDSSKIFTVSAWTAGRIDQLYVDQEETMIEQGQLLYAIYSPEVSSTLRDYHLISNRADDNEQVLASIHTRLRQHGLTDSIIAQLDAEKTVPDQIDIPSPIAGLVMKKMVRLGAYVKKGDPLYTVVDLSELWLIIEVYENELPFISLGMPVTATTAAAPGRVFNGTIELINHHVNTHTRTVQVRVVFDAPSQSMAITRKADGSMHHLLLPDMWMNAKLQRDLGENLTVPASAIFDTGNRQYVFVEQSEGLFVPTIVTLGPKVDARQTITSGLNEDDLVVVDGTFLLDSESQLKASVNSSPSAANTSKEEPDAPLAAQEWPNADADAITRLISSYGKIHQALTQDTTSGIAAALEQMTTIVSELKNPTATPKGIRTKLTQLTNTLGSTATADLRSSRQQFGEISAALIDLFQNYPPPLDAPINIAHCQMWSDSPSDWLQTDTVIANPFLGQTMPSCGEVTGQIGKEVQL